MEIFGSPFLFGSSPSGAWWDIVWQNKCGKIMFINKFFVL
jgi:hypothetical protein